jgi:hypothetical protein
VGVDNLIVEVFCEAVDLFAQIMPLKQMAEAQDRGLIRDPIADQLNARKTGMVGTSIKASSIAGSLSEYHSCNRCMRSIVASGYGGRPPFLLVLE